MSSPPSADRNHTICALPPVSSPPAADRSHTICALPAATRNLVRSAYMIPDMATAVEEVCCNSIDAGATTINIHAHVGTHFFSVADDGSGMDDENFAAVCQHFHTSKRASAAEFNKLKSFGFRGEALASIAELGFVQITTRSPRSAHALEKVSHGGAVLYSGPSRHVHLAGGTIVAVSKLFFNMPLRRNLRGAHHSLQVDRIRQRVSLLALLHPHVQFILFDDQAGAKILHCRRSESIRARFAALFDHDLAASLVSIPRSGNSEFSVDGLLCPFDRSHSNSDLQFIFVNGRIVGVHEVSNLMQLVFALVQRILYDSQSSHSASPSSASSRTQNPHRRVKRHSFFVLRIQCRDPDCFDVLLEPGKQTQLCFCPAALASINELLAASIMRVLRDHSSEMLLSSTETSAASASSNALDLLHEPLARFFRELGIQQTEPSAVDFASHSMAATAQTHEESSETRSNLAFDLVPSNSRIQSISFCSRNGGVFDAADHAPVAFQSSSSFLNRSSGSVDISDFCSTSIISRIAEHSADNCIGNSSDSDQDSEPEQSCTTRDEPLADAAIWSQGESLHVGRTENCADPDSDEDSCVAWLHAQRPILDPSSPDDGGQVVAESMAVPPLSRSLQTPACFASSRARPATEADLRPAVRFASAKSNKRKLAASFRSSVGSVLQLPRNVGSKSDSARHRGSPSSCPSISIDSTHDGELDDVSEQELLDFAAFLDTSTTETTDATSINSIYLQFRERDVKTRLLVANSGAERISSASASACDHRVIETAAIGISRETLQQMRVIAQIEKKFLVCVTATSIFILDQHAGDERIRLNRLEDDVLGVDRQCANVTASTILPPLSFNVTPHEAHLIERFRMQQLKWQFDVLLEVSPPPSPSGESTDAVAYEPSNSSLHASMRQAPTIGELTLTQFDLLEYLALLEQESGSSLSIPPAILRILNMRACRSAVKFGDTLLPAHQRDLLDALKATRLPFQCAHGRPSMAPLLRIPPEMRIALADALFEERRPHLKNILS